MKRSELAKELKRLALMRGTELEPDAYPVYVDELMRFQMDDVESALQAIGREPRKSFEKPFPEVGVLIAECERQEKLRRSSLSAVRACLNKECIQGMVRVFNGEGWCTGVVACPACGGPPWLMDALDKNKWLLKENGLL